MAVCTTVQPPTHADLCDIQAFSGEINQLYFTRYGDSLTDWTSDAEWATRLDNDLALPIAPDLAAIRSLYGIGSIGAAERATINVGRRVSLSSTPKYSFTFQVYDTGDTNMELVTLLPAAGQVYSCWFGTEDRLFGGNDGIQMTMIADPIIPESIDEFMTIQFTLTFSGTFPEVTDNFLS